MNPRPRIDLDGVPLVDEARPPMVLAIFRYRTAEGLALLIPESAEVLVPWEHVEAATLDLAAGTVRIAFQAAYVERQSWLRGARAITGTWTDRFVMSGAPFPRRD
jgi:predicted RNA methylase